MSELSTKTPNPARSAVSGQVVTTTTEFTSLTRAIYVGTAGDLPVVFDGDTSATTISDAANGYHPLQVKSINGTGLTASDVVALF
jgi:hypothetical protein